MKFFTTGVSVCENRLAFNWKTSNYLGSKFYQNQAFWSCLNFFIKSTIMELDANMSFYAEVLSVETLHFARNQFLFIYSTGGSSSSCEMIILRNKSNGKIIWVCIGIFTTAFRNKKKHSQILTKIPHLLQCIACNLTAYYADSESSISRFTTYARIPKSDRKYSHTNSYYFAITLTSQDDHLTVGTWPPLVI